MTANANDTAVGMATSSEITTMVLTALAEGTVNQAIDYFGEQFTFKDYGLGLEFHDKEQLAEFFLKERQFYPDALRIPESVVASGNHVISQWTLSATMTEPWLARTTRKVSIRTHGISVAEIEDGKIVAWSDYYDRLQSRRNALAAYFAEWVEP